MSLLSVEVEHFPPTTRLLVEPLIIYVFTAVICMRKDMQSVLSTTGKYNQTKSKLKIKTKSLLQYECRVLKLNEYISKM